MHISYQHQWCIWFLDTSDWLHNRYSIAVKFHERDQSVSLEQSVSPFKVSAEVISAVGALPRFVVPSGIIR